MDRWMDPNVDEACTVIVKGVGEFRVRGFSDDLYHVLPSREPVVLNAISNTLKAGDTFIDAGANIGVYTVLASKIVGPTGHVFAVEMMPDTAAILTDHLHRNGCQNVTVVQRALSDRAGQAIEATVTPEKYGQASISTSIGSNRVVVRTSTLAEIIRG